MNKVEKIAKTVCLMFVWICIGLFTEVVGPTLIDLKTRISADYEQMAFAVSGRFVGSFIGSVIGGALVDKYGSYCELMIGLCLTSASVVTVFVPHSSSVELLWFTIMLIGSFEGVINVVGQKLVLIIWKEKAASPLHLLHSGYGIGSFIIPLIASPFLAIAKPGTGQNITLNNTLDLFENASSTPMEYSGNMSQIDSTNTTLTGTAPIEYLRESNIKIPYIVVAIITLTLSSVFYADHIRGQRKRKTKTPPKEGQIKHVVEKGNNTNRKSTAFQSFKKMINPATCSGGRFLYGVEIFALLFIYFANVFGGESIVGKFILIYSVEQLGFSVSEGSYINTVFWISFAAGRILGFVVARFIPIRILVLIESGGILLSVICMNIFAPTSAPALWVLTGLTGLFIGPGFPSGIGWADYHVELSGVAITFLLLGGSVGGVMCLRLAGFLFETYGPGSILYFILASGIASFTLAVLLNLIGRQHGNRFKWTKNEEECNHELELEMTEKEHMIEHKA